MPSYFYHLKLELYPNPSADLTSTISKPETKTKIQEGDLRHERENYLPANGCDIFETRDWPAHKAVKQDLGTRRLGVGKEGSGSDKVARGQKTVCRGVIDCGPTRAKSSSEDESERITIHIAQTAKLEPPPLSTARVVSDLGTARKDWRFGRVRVESMDMVETQTQHVVRTRGESSSGIAVAESPNVNAALAAPELGRVTKARYRALSLEKGTEVGWGVVHLYRDGEETLGLGNVDTATDMVDEEECKENDCTVLCIPAVPSYLTPSDFLGFVGGKTRDAVSHIRMVMTERMNRYLVLMKFRDGRMARRWRKEWDGKVFNSMEPETCQVVIIKTITVQTPTTSRPNTSFPELSHDPFTPSSATSTFLKPFPPPTPSLIELPTCPVCLERMDDTTGLLTILCQHVFHCSCLSKWSGGGCPVCRHTNPSLAQQSLSNSTSNQNANTYDATNPPFGSGEASLCSVCDTTDDLWICLICGNVGCGRYKGGHAKEHWKECAHNFALEMETQHVWDYAGDLWVHRLIRNKGDSKLIELPARSAHGDRREGRGESEEDMVPRSKLEGIGIEYTHLLSSQLDSQRVYFEDLVGKASAKASAASQIAAEASKRLDEAVKQLEALTLSHTVLRNETLPQVERELEREKRKAEKSAEVARGFGRSLVEERRVGEGLLERIKHVNNNMAILNEEVKAVRLENEELKEANRDLLFSISAGQKIAEMGEGEGGEVERSELEGGSLSLPPEKKKRGGKGKGKV